MKLTLKQLELLDDLITKEIIYSRNEGDDIELLYMKNKVTFEIAKRKQPGGACKQCGKVFEPLDIITAKTRPVGICTSCFLSNQE